MFPLWVLHKISSGLTPSVSAQHRPIQGVQSRPFLHLSHRILLQASFGLGISMFFSSGFAEELYLSL